MSDIHCDSSPLLYAALRYARRGWYVIPVGAGPDRKLPFIKNWTNEASTEEARVREWWSIYPDANVGVVTGPKSGFWVVDVDMKNGVCGMESLVRRFGMGLVHDVDRCLVGQTATGGFHFLFQWEPSTPVRNGQAVLPGVDIRGDGGQIVVAPSYRFIDGERRAYAWNDEALPVGPAPAWAKELATGARVTASRAMDLSGVLSGLPNGSRDTELWRYACHLAGRGVPLTLALGFMGAAADRCVPPFDPNVAREKVLRAYRDTASPQVVQEAIRSIEQEIHSRKESNHE